MNALPDWVIILIGLGVYVLARIGFALADRIKATNIRACVDCGDKLHSTTDGTTCMSCRIRRRRALDEAARRGHNRDTNTERPDAS